MVARGVSRWHGIFELVVVRAVEWRGVKGVCVIGGQGDSDPRREVRRMSDANGFGFRKRMAPQDGPLDNLILGKDGVLVRKGERQIVVVVSHNAEQSFSSPFPSGIAVVMISPFTVVPLQRGDAAPCCGLSQLLQSLSSNESTDNGVHEKCLVRFEFVLRGRCMFAVLSDSARGSENLEGGVGVICWWWSLLLLLNALATCGREDVTDARIVSLSVSLCRLEILRPLPEPVMGSSPTATCRRSSTNVHRPDLKSSAICFMPAAFDDGDVDDDRGVQVARFDTPLAASGCLVRFWK